MVLIRLDSWYNSIMMKLKANITMAVNTAPNSMHILFKIYGVTTITYIIDKKVMIPGRTSVKYWYRFFQFKEIIYFLFFCLEVPF